MSQQVSKKNLYRKYRPASFSELLGQDHIVKTLQNAISLGRISHAYMFCGPRGTGKTSAARLLAKVLNCQGDKKSEKLPDACRKCEICEKIETATFVDIIEIDAASNNSVDDIREMREKVKYRPVEGLYKIYIIDEVHMLSGAAFNAFLKTLEEPPPKVVFILATTDPQKVPATILSRCQLFDFHSVSKKVITERLAEIVLQEKSENHEFPDVSTDVIQIIAECAEGGFRDALSLLDQITSVSSGNSVKVEDVLELTRRLGFRQLFQIASFFFSGDSASLVSQLNALFSSGYDVSSIGKELLEFIRKLLLLKIDPKISQVLEIPSEQIDLFSQLPISIEKLLQISHRLEKTLSQLRYSVSPKFLFEVEILRLCRGDYSISSEEFEKKFLELECSIKSPRFILRHPSQSQQGQVQTPGSYQNVRPVSAAPVSTFSNSNSDIPSAQVRAPVSTSSSRSPSITAYSPEPPVQKQDYSGLSPHEKWSTFLTVLSRKFPSTASFFANSQFLSFESNVLKVSLPTEFALNKVRESKSQDTYKPFLHEIFGNDTSLSPIFSGSDSKAPVSKASAEKAFSEFNQTIKKLDKEVKAKILAKPPIKDALEIFEGEVIEVIN
ncbi:MAG: DNA polymerase III subunit gamma/tau [Candidatus Riflebacteria bacterium]|nr:DNA polymerase III subunit gamma/tau [Candidatus Riflebacteria bacterium]